MAIMSKIVSLCKACSTMKLGMPPRQSFVRSFQSPHRRIDWTELGVVSPVRCQKGYSTCWAFQVDAALSALYYIATQQTLIFSPQELIDNDAGGDKQPWKKRDRNWIGNVFEALQWVKTNGLSLEEDYPYRGSPSPPRPRREFQKLFFIDGVGNVPRFREDLLEMVVERHPVSASMFLNNSDVGMFATHEGGVLRPSGPMRVGDMSSHSVQIVGFDELNGKKVWKLKNSHGPKWGENGFFYLYKDVINPWDNCLLALRPVYPILNGVNDNLLAAVGQKKLQQFRQGAITGLKKNSDLVRIDVEASILQKKLDGMTATRDSIGGHKTSSKESTTATIEVDMLQILSESLASSTTKGEKRVSDHRFQKAALQFCLGKTTEVSQIEKDLATEVSGLKKQRVELEAEVKKVRDSR